MTKEEYVQLAKYVAMFKYVVYKNLYQIGDLDFKEELLRAADMIISNRYILEVILDNEINTKK